MLDIANGKDEDGANIGIYQGYGGDAQKFVVKNTNNGGIYTIGTKVSNAVRYIDVYEHKTADGTNVCQWLYYGNPNQQWQFEPVRDAQPGQGGNQQEQPQQGSGSQEQAKGLVLTTSINNWGSGYQVSYKVTNNTGSAVNSWTLKIPTDQVKIDSSWNVNVTVQGGNYVITPVNWNSHIENGQSIEFGSCGTGSIGSTIGYSFN